VPTVFIQYVSFIAPLSTAAITGCTGVMLCATKLLCLLRRGDTTGSLRYFAKQYSRFVINFENKQLNGTVFALSVCESTDHPPRNWPTTPLDDDVVSARVFIATAWRLFVSVTKK
jgi:hypothetical protein